MYRGVQMAGIFTYIEACFPIERGGGVDDFCAFKIDRDTHRSLILLY